MIWYLVADGLKIFIVLEQINNEANRDLVYRYDLTSPYDISTCVLCKSRPVILILHSLFRCWRYGNLGLKKITVTRY